MRRWFFPILIATALCQTRGQEIETPIDPNPSAGPFASSLRDDENPCDAPIAGFVGPDGVGKAHLQSGVDIDGNPVYANPNNYINPVFKAWATVVMDYSPTPGVASNWKNSTRALGPVTGNNFDIVTLGDLYSASPVSWGPNGTGVLNPPPVGTYPPYVFGSDPARVPYSGAPSDPNDGFGFIGYDNPGSITLGFEQAIANGGGADFAVFENGFTSNYTTGAGSIEGGVFAELAYVEVSTDDIHFARFPSVSLTPYAVGMYGTIDPSNAFNLAGKSANAYGESWGTPFDLDTLIDPTAILDALAAAGITPTENQLASLQHALDANIALVEQGLLDLNNINFVRLVDIPGSGYYTDSLGNPVFDAWYTFGSGGFDLDAVGIISHFEAWQDRYGLTGDQRSELADPDSDGLPNLLEYAAGLSPLSPDSPSALQWLSFADGRLSLMFRRDAYAVDLTLEVEASSDLQNWEVIARSIGAKPFQPVSPHAPQISGTSADGIGVTTVTDNVSGLPRRFMRLRAQKTP